MNLELIYRFSQILNFFNENTKEKFFSLSKHEQFEILCQQKNIVLDNIWEHENFKECVQNEEKKKKLQTYLNKITLVKGVTKCKKCGCEQNLIETKQTRRSDESTSVFVKCGKCKNNWVL